MFSSKSKRYIAAFLSCLQHDVKVASNCLKYHLLSEYNPFSVACREDLKTLCDALDLFYKHIDDPEFQHNALKGF